MAACPAPYIPQYIITTSWISGHLYQTPASPLHTKQVKHAPVASRQPSVCFRHAWSTSSLHKFCRTADTIHRAGSARPYPAAGRGRRAARRCSVSSCSMRAETSSASFCAFSSAVTRNTVSRPLASAPSHSSTGSSPAVLQQPKCAGREVASYVSG